MKRIGNIFNRIIDFNNLVLADKKARLNKSKRYGIAKFDKHSHENLLKLQRMFIEGTYKTSEYDIYTIIADRGHKEREIYRLPFNLWKRFTGTNSIKELKILLLGYDKNCT